MTNENTLYIRHRETGATHAYQGRRYAKLKKEIQAGCGEEIVTSLICSGYEGFLGKDGELYAFDGLSDHFSDCD